MAKRRRTAAGGAFTIPRAQRRPIDKDLIGIVITNAGTVQRTTVLKTTTFPCTITGLRWSWTFASPLTGDSTQGIWVIAVVPDGEAINTISISDGATIISPEQSIVAFGSYGADNIALGGPGVMLIEGSTKTMRKLRGGDVLLFACIMSAGTAGRIRGTVQFFCKT